MDTDTVKFILIKSKQCTVPVMHKQNQGKGPIGQKGS